MAFDNLTDFFEMGRHGVYVWSVYGFSTVSLALITWSTLSKRHQIQETLRKRFLRDKTI
ncbi:hemagglutination activity protein [Marinomonas ushuaiensis DSM 15871]|uniref:Heme exporter protein D n=1 Tax=Marinomonas ushuaiensis DSM 15871 TaxID=1122207 RepID=X7E6S8_9GAMM|nr:hemagglutination activity protein [Marinomonas ushuaiensis DSM 15871]